MTGNANPADRHSVDDALRRLRKGFRNKELSAPRSTKEETGCRSAGKIIFYNKKLQRHRLCSRIHILRIRFNHYSFVCFAGNDPCGMFRKNERSVHSSCVADQKYHGRTQYHIDDQFNDEIESDHHPDNGENAAVFRLEAAEDDPDKENESGGVDNRSSDRGTEHGGFRVLPFQLPVDQGGDDPAQHALGEDGKDGAGYRHTEEKRGISGKEHGNPEDKSEPRAGKDTVQCAADHDRNQNRGDREHAETDMDGCLKDNDDSRQDPEDSQLFCVEFFHFFFLIESRTSRMPFRGV